MEHTKEPWVVSNMGDIQGPDCADGDDFVAIQVRGSPRQSQYGVPKRAEQRANLQRAVDCVNAFAGIPDPAAYVAAMGALADAAELLCDPEIPAGHGRWADLRAALATARTTIGERDV